MSRQGLIGILVLAMVLVCWLLPVHAESNPESKLKEIQQNKNDVKQEMHQTQQVLKEQKKKVDALERQVGQLNDQITEHQQRLQENQKLLEKQRKQFENVLVRMYQKGEHRYINLLFSANSFSEFLARLEMLRIWVKSEKMILDQYAQTQQNIEKEMAEIQKKKKELDPILAEAKVELDQYTKLYNQQKTKLSQLEHEEHLTQEQINRKNQVVRLAHAGGNYGTGKLLWPQPGGRITSEFGWRNGRMHEGIDIANSIGAPILAADSGVVVLTKSDPGGYGYYVVIDHGNGLKTLYAHMYPSTVKVRVGQKVIKGQRIASVGDSGNASGAHLHFETLKNGKPVDPMLYFR